MNFLKYIKTILFFLLIFLLGEKTTYAKTELISNQGSISFSIEQIQNFKSLEKEVPPNIGFLKGKTKFGAPENVSAQNSYYFFEYSVGNLANAGGDLLNASGKFIDDVLEVDYLAYVTRKTNAGKVPKSRLDWKEAVDYWNLDSPTALGKAFEGNAFQELITTNSTLRNKLNNLGIDLSNYEVFKQVQVKTGNIINDIEEYTVVDILLIKKNNIAGIQTLDFNDCIALETKLNFSTALTNPQNGLLNNVGNSFVIRSKSRVGNFSPSSSIGSQTTIKNVKVNDYIKIWSDGSGASVLDIQSLK